MGKTADLGEGGSEMYFGVQMYGVSKEWKHRTDIGMLLLKIRTLLP